MSRKELSGEGATSLISSVAFREEQFEDYLPFVSLVDDETILTRGGEYMQCIRVNGLNSMTANDEALIRLKKRIATIIAQTEGRFSFYIHKISKRLSPEISPVCGDGFAAEVDRRWQSALSSYGLRDKTLTITVMRRPAASRSVSAFEKVRARFAKDKVEDQKQLRQRRLASLREVVSILLSATEGMSGRALTASSGELLGFLEAIGSGTEVPTYPLSEIGILARSVANFRPTFASNRITLSGGNTGRKNGLIFTIKNYPNQTEHGMFDSLNLPHDMVITHSFTPIPNDVMEERIRRAQKMMASMNDAGVSDRELLASAADELVTGKLVFGGHHMTAAIYSSNERELAEAAADIQQVAQEAGVKVITEAFASRAHYFAQFPGNAAFRSRIGTITNRNFAGLASLHRTPLGKNGDEVPWKDPITVFPTPEGSGYQFSFHRKLPRGNVDAEPPAGHTLILGPSGGGKSVLIAFLIAQAQRMNARVFAFDYRRGLEVPLRALGAEYSEITANRPTGLNPLWSETDPEGQQWLSEWITALIERAERPLTAQQSQFLQDAIRRNADAPQGLRHWSQFASLFAPLDDDGDLESRIREWAPSGRYGWIFGGNREDTFSLNGDLVGFDLTSVLDNGNDKERAAVLGYIFRRLERAMQDRRPTIIVVDEAWRALDTDYFADKLQGWLVTLRKLNCVVLLVTQFATQIANSKAGASILQGVQTQILLPNDDASAQDFAALNLNAKELTIMLETPPGKRVALVRDDQGSVLLDTDLTDLGQLLMSIGNSTAGRAALAAPDFDPEFWRTLK